MPVECDHSEMELWLGTNSHSSQFDIRVVPTDLATMGADVGSCRIALRGLQVADLASDTSPPSASLETYWLSTVLAGA